MEVRVISLPTRQDRRDKFEADNKIFLEGHNWKWSTGFKGSGLTLEKLQKIGFDTDKYWRDHILKRNLTWGEIGCFISHWKLWEECADSGVPMLIMEDDAVLRYALDEEWLSGDLTYLAYKEMLPGGVKNDQVCYPYWCAAYIITPKAAEIFLDTDADENIIPVDEFIPRMTDRVKMTFVDKAGQLSRTESGSNIEPKSEDDYVRDFTIHNWTCHDSDEKAHHLIYSNPSVDNILETDWAGGTMVGPGGGQKIQVIQNRIASLPDHDVVIFTDGFDVFWTSTINDVIGRFLGMKAEVVFAAEDSLWPDKSLRFPATETDYRYLNSGCFVGRVGELKRILAEPIGASDDDQLYLQKAFLSGRFDITLDTEQYIFATNSDAVTIQKDRVFNAITKCYGCIYHGNGGDQAKLRFNNLFALAFPETKFTSLSVSDYKVIGNEMILVDFLSPSQCEEWIRIGDENGSWNPHPADKFPSHDIHLKTLGLWDEVDAWWNKIAARVFQAYWKPTLNYHLRKAFLMKYSDDTQKTLGLHNDASMVTGSVKLNNNYEGATLIFPRQEVTNADIPIGKMILFPGQVTHGHFVDPLTSGTKFSATFWSARYNGDLFDPD